MLKTRTSQKRPAWTGYYDRDCGSRLIKLKSQEPSTVCDSHGEPIAHIDHYLIGLHSGRVEYAMVTHKSNGDSATSKPVPWELLKASGGQPGFELLTEEDRLLAAPDAAPNWDYLSCTRIYNHFGLFY